MNQKIYSTTTQRCGMAWQAVMADPVVLGGVSYERAAAEEWVAVHGAVSPEDGRPLRDATLLPNHTLRAILQAMNALPP